MDKPTPDGRVTLWLHQGEPLEFNFAEISSHGPREFGWVIHWARRDGHPVGRTQVPYQSIAWVDIEYNSQEYQKQHRQWENETHQEHETTDNLDSSCQHCQIILNARDMLGGIK